MGRAPRNLRNVAPCRAARSPGLSAPMTKEQRCDVAIIGAGPVGCTAALAFSERGASVVVFEANVRAATRLAGEWLHPPAVEILRRLRVDLPALVDYPTGRGFVVFPEDGSSPIVLPY